MTTSSPKTRHAIRLPAMLGLLGLLITLALPAAAQELPKDRLVFQAAISKSKMEDTIERSIEEAVDDMNFLVKPIAESRLEGSNEAIAWVMFETKQPGKLSIQIAGRDALTSPADGSAIKWKREDGETVTVRQKVEDGAVTQIFEAEDGTKAITYDFSEDYQTMTLKVKVTSPKLDAPLTYTLPFKRASQG